MRTKYSRVRYLSLGIAVAISWQAFPSSCIDWWVAPLAIPANIATKPSRILMKVYWDVRGLPAMVIPKYCGCDQCFPLVHSVLWDGVHLSHLIIMTPTTFSSGEESFCNFKSTIYMYKIWLWNCETVTHHHLRHTHHVLLSADLESHDVPSSKIHVNSVCLNRWQPEYWIWGCYISYHVNVSSPFLLGLHGKKDKLLSHFESLTNFICWDLNYDSSTSITRDGRKSNLETATSYSQSLWQQRDFHHSCVSHHILDLGSWILELAKVKMTYRIHLNSASGPRK